MTTVSSAHKDAEPALPEDNSRALPYYSINEKVLGVDASLGNSFIWVSTKATGAIEPIFNVSVGESLFGAIYVRYAALGHRLLPKRVDEPEHHNEGALWSKVNMRRVMASYPQGLASTNDPGLSSNVVGRDAAWFIYGIRGRWISPRRAQRSLIAI